VGASGANNNVGAAYIYYGTVTKSALPSGTFNRGCSSTHTTYITHTHCPDKTILASTHEHTTHHGTTAKKEKSKNQRDSPPREHPKPIHRVQHRVGSDRLEAQTEKSRLHWRWAMTQSTLCHASVEESRRYHQIRQHFQDRSSFSATAVCCSYNVAKCRGKSKAKQTKGKERKGRNNNKIVRALRCPMELSSDLLHFTNKQANDVKFKHTAFHTTGLLIWPMHLSHWLLGLAYVERRFATEHE